MFDIIERIVLHDKAIQKLVETTDKMNKVISGLVEQGKCSTQLDIVQAMINDATDSRISKLESNDVVERLDHMEEYLDKLTKRIKSLEK